MWFKKNTRSEKSYEDYTQFRTLWFTFFVVLIQDILTHHSSEDDEDIIRDYVARHFKSYDNVFSCPRMDLTMSYDRQKKSSFRCDRLA